VRISRSEPFLRVRRLWQQIDAKRLDVSHLIDRTYGYHSERELRSSMASRALPEDVSRSPRGTSWNLAIG
jgi:hypothetical protein